MTNRFISPEQVVKWNFIKDYMYGAEIAGGHKAYLKKPQEMEYGIILLVIDGRIVCEINNARHEFRKGKLVNFPTWMTIGSMEFSDNFHGIVVAVKNDIVIDIFRSRSPFPPSFVYRLNGIINSPDLDDREQKIIAGDMRNLIGAIGNKRHHYLEELAYAHFYILLTDIADIIWERYGDGFPERNMELSRQDAIIRDFMKLALEESEHERNIDYYADSLCISRQYLSMIVKEKIGVPIGICLARIRYEKTLRLMKDSTLTPQQIASKMNFADQSSFGKFFKRHNGMSPQQYRKSLKKNLLTGYYPTEMPDFQEQP